VGKVRGKSIIHHGKCIKGNRPHSIQNLKRSGI